MSQDKYYIFETTPPIKYRYRYRLSFGVALSQMDVVIRCLLSNRLREIDAVILSSKTYEIVADMNIKVEEVAEILHEHGIDRATIKQTENKAYSLRERG